MKPDKHTLAIEQILQKIPELERNLNTVEKEEERIRTERALKFRRKRFERLIPYKFRLKLRSLCKQAGVVGDFMQS